MSAVTPAITAMLAFGLFTHMACGAIYALVPFIDRKALGGVAGIIGAGGNVGAVAAGFLVKGVGHLPTALFIIGCSVVFCAICAAAIRFSPAHKSAEQELFDEAVAQRGGSPEGVPAMA
jgi:NNP family nitrate/nitrite transporter-like MFS transporter